jgi:hypothetical protein
LKYDIPLGFNVNGLLVKHSKLDYPCDFFWKMVAKTKCQVIIETDAHCADTLSKKIVNQAIKLIHEWKLEPNLIDELIIK